MMLSWIAQFYYIPLQFYDQKENCQAPKFNPDSILEIYSMKMLLHIYFFTHFSVINIDVTTSVVEKFRAS